MTPELSDTIYLGGSSPMFLERHNNTMSFEWNDDDTASVLVDSYHFPGLCHYVSDTFTLSLHAERPWYYWRDHQLATAQIRFSSLIELLDLCCVRNHKKFDDLCAGDPFSRCTFTGKNLTLWMKLSEAEVKMEFSRV